MFDAVVDKRNVAVDKRNVVIDKRNVVIDKRNVVVEPVETTNIRVLCGFDALFGFSVFG